MAISTETLRKERAMSGIETGQTNHDLEEGLNPEILLICPIERVRGIRKEDLPIILSWMLNPDVARHLDPIRDFPEITPDTALAEDITKKALGSLERYYDNDGEPSKIMPFVATDKEDKILAVATLRWKGDKLIKSPKTASIEKLIVDPKKANQRIGTSLVATMVNFAFNSYTGYTGGQHAREVRAWVFTDDKAGEWISNYKLFRRLGFQAVPGDTHWIEYAATREPPISTEGRDAMWLGVIPEGFNNAKKRAIRENKSVIPCENFHPSILR